MSPEVKLREVKKEGIEILVKNVPAQGLGSSLTLTIAYSEVFWASISPFTNVDDGEW